MGRPSDKDNLQEMINELKRPDRPDRPNFIRLNDLAQQGDISDDNTGSILFHRAVGGQVVRVKRNSGESMNDLLLRLYEGFPPTFADFYQYEVEPTGKTKDDLRSTDYEAKPVSKDDRTADWESDPKFKK